MAKSPSREYSFTLQWHVTARCQYNCTHCYVKEEQTYESELNNELPFAGCLKILDDFERFTKNLRVCGRINFSGGDPLLREDIWELLYETRRRKFHIGIIGNPNFVTEETSRRLASTGVESYQISIDGLAETHDRLRGKKGLFDDSIRALKILKATGIETCVMLTLSRDNITEVNALMEYLGEVGINSFSFARISAVGAGKKYQTRQILPLEYRDFLIRVEQKVEELKRKGVTTKYGRKCHLWKLLESEKGHLSLPDDKKTIYDGCTIGITGLIILADGTVYACRRFPSPVGKVPEQKLLDVFLHSKQLNEYRNSSLLKKCSRCELGQLCRGCPAVAYGAHGSWREEDPQCWKQL